jgi:hypothetical protein
VRGLLLEPVLLRISNPLLILLLQPQPAIVLCQPGNMQAVDDLPEFPEWVEAVLVLIMKLMFVLIVVLQTILRTFGVCIVADILTYWRGY